MKIANNLLLPELPVWQARSFWVQLLLALSVLLNMAGIDLFAFFGAAGIGATPDQIIATGERVVSAWQQIMPLVLGLWAWIERRAPNYRLTWSVPAAFIPCLIAGLMILLLILPPGILI